MLKSYFPYAHFAQGMRSFVRGACVHVGVGAQRLGINCDARADAQSLDIICNTREACVPAWYNAQVLLLFRTFRARGMRSCVRGVCVHVSVGAHI